MSDKAPQYEIRITSVHVPEALRGVPLPVEIIPPEGEAKHSLITIEENRTETEPVEWPGTYTVRLVLPSGQRVSATGTVKEMADPQSIASGDVSLDFRPVEARYGAGVGERIRMARNPDERQLLADQTSNKYLPTRSGKIKTPPRTRGLRQPVRGLASADDVTVRYGFFQRWETESSSKNLETAPDTLVITRVGEASTDLPGCIQLERHPGWVGDSSQSRPLLMHARYLSTKPGGEALILYPPSDNAAPLTLLPDSDPEVNSVAPPLLALSKTDDSEIDLLFSYVLSGKLDLARAYAPRMIERAQRLLQLKASNPVNATLAAYVLLKVSNDERADWVRNLANWFGHLPDGAIIYGWHLLQAGKAEQAHEYFSKALSRGVPMFSEGIRLLRDGLNFLHGLDKKNSQVLADAARANRISASANLDSELTCLRLGKGLAINFVNQ